MTTKTCNWGILTCGKVSSDFVNALKSVSGANVVACAARNIEHARQFGETHGIPNRYGSYEELVKDPLVQVVYIGSIHTVHYEHTLLALNHGKHVLVEKPVAINRKQAEEMYKVAEEKKNFLLWKPCGPFFSRRLSKHVN